MSTDVATAFDPQSVRGDFPLLATTVHGQRPLVYLDNAATSQRCRAVLEAMREVEERCYANVHRGAHYLSERATELYESAREKIARFLNAGSSREVIFTSGTTDGLNLLARGWGDAFLEEGDEILLSVMEHHSNIVPWQQLAERKGCRLRWLPIRDDGHWELQSLPSLLNERTKLVSLMAVSNVLGTRNDLRPILDRAKSQGAVTVVDAAQSAPHEPTDVQEIGADFLVFSGHKLAGPSGIGVLWGREEMLELMPPARGGGSMIDRVTLDGFTTAALPAKFEAGTPPIVAAIGLGAAVDYLQSVGLAAIQEHEARLTRQAHALLEPIEGMRIFGPPPEAKAGIVSFFIDGTHPQDLAQLLDQQGVAIRAGHHCTMPLHERLGVPVTARASFYLYTTEDEIAQLAAGIEKALRLLR